MSRRASAPAAALVALLVAACGAGGAPTPTPGTPASSPVANPVGSSRETSSPAPSTTATPGPASAPPPPLATRAPGGDPSAARVTLRTVASGLQAPLFATGAGDGSGRIFIVEQGGVVRIVRDGRLLASPFLDVSASISSGGERGLLGLAFEPGFGQPGRDRFFTDSTNPNGDTEVAELRVSATDPDRADPASRRVLLTVQQPFPNHNGGMLAFGPDGDLYVGLGDGGSGGDPQGNGQRLDTLLGKILRIDVSAAAGGQSYAIPAGNPFAGRSGARPEIWASGLRNPWRFSFDRASGDLWIGDVGQNRYEEIDLARAGTGGGANYGWNRMEGDHCFQPAVGCDASGLTLPVAEYGHDQGCAVVGGYVDRAPDAGPLAGVYLFADECSGRVWGLDSAAVGRQDPVLLAGGGHAIASFGEDDAGDVYATDLASGELLEVVGQAR